MILGLATAPAPALLVLLSIVEEASELRDSESESKINKSRTNYIHRVFQKVFTSNPTFLNGNKISHPLSYSLYLLL